MEINTDVEFRDEAIQESEKGLSIKEIILRQIRKIGDISSKEFTGGYWQKKPIATQAGLFFSEVYHEDVREAYCNAVDFLVDVVYPLGDKDLQDYLNSYELPEKEWDSEEIKQKLQRKRITFRKINEMFERTEFWKGTTSYNE